MAGVYAVLPAGYRESLYFQLTGGADSGLAYIVLDHVHKHALAGDKALAYVEVDPRNTAHVQEACALSARSTSASSAPTSSSPSSTQTSHGQRAPTRRRALRGDHGLLPEYYHALTWGAAQLGGYDWWGSVSRKSTR